MGGALGGLWLIMQAHYTKITREFDSENELDIPTGNIEDDCKAIDILLYTMLALSVIFLVGIVFIACTS